MRGHGRCLSFTSESKPDSFAAGSPRNRRPYAVRCRATPRRRRNWYAYGLIAPAVTFMVLVHLIPTTGGILLYFKRLNTFTCPSDEPLFSKTPFKSSTAFRPVSIARMLSPNRLKFSGSFHAASRVMNSVT